ncbi:nitrite reductase large subunit NirB [Salinifilum ghardaiensis]
MTSTLIIIGHGMVGHRLVEEMRARDNADAWRVLVFAEEERPAYDRVALSSYIQGTTAEELSLGSGELFADPMVQLHLGNPVTGIDRDAQQVTTREGAVFAYDALVLATGSRPFVPPVPGRELDGCFVYRTIEDLDAIRQAAVAGRPGVVVGGGLLGLEAANALRLLGMDTHVVEMAPRLMPLQVDEGGGQVLDGLVTDLGLSTHCGAATQSIDGGYGRVTAVTLGDGTVLATDVVVFSAGVRPCDDLAEPTGLERGERGGFLVDEQCRTADERIWAVGECAAVAGQCYGLVAPGYSMAEGVAEQLVAGGAGTFPGADLSTKLKLLGVDVASFGDAHGRSAGALEVVYTNNAAGTYAKLVLSDDAQTLLGGVLVGDAAAYGTLRPLVGRELPAPPEQLLLPAGAEVGAGGLPGDATVCSCNNVCKDAVVGAVQEGATDVGGLKARTKAGTSCGSCVPMLTKLLGECGVVTSKALCEHFAQSRAELFEIVRATTITSFSELISRYGSGSGCAICKPAVASILASLGTGHVLDGEQAALQDTNDRFLANMQRNGTYSVVPRVPGGEITPDKLIVLGEVARDFGLYTKITGGQRVDLFGARVEQLPQIWQRLVDAGFESGHAYGKALRTVKSCVGNDWCRYGVQDSVSMAIRLELRYRGLRSPHKIKAAVSGCARECAEANSKDFGVIATENGWNLYVGGNGGFAPRHAQLLAGDLGDDELIRLVDRFLVFYIRSADRLQRTSAWLEELDGGLEHLRSVVVDDALGICADLEEAMHQHVVDYTDEWAAVLRDPDKLARFVSFVNAPETPDPTISFTEERGQIRPNPVTLPQPAVRDREEVQA